MSLETAPPHHTPSNEQRRHGRVEFFLVPVRREQLPVWVFKPDDLAAGHAGLVVNAGAGGLQVFTAADAPLTGSSYRLHLLDATGGAGPAARPEVEVQRVWSRELTRLGTLSGFRFAEEDEHAGRLLTGQLSADIDPPGWVRCVLLPC